jgi:hypothetical protein
MKLAIYEGVLGMEKSGDVLDRVELIMLRYYE